MSIKTILVLVILVLIVLILLHHRYIHHADSKKSPIQKWFQWDDVDNHETIIVGLLGFILGLLLFSFIL